MAATRSRRTLFVLCLASAGWAFSFGLGAPLASLWLRDAECSQTCIGLNTSAYYLGLALAAPAAPGLMKWSGRGCVVAGMVLDALSVALFPWGGGPVGWFLLRFTGGLSTALCLVPMETLVNHNAPPERRSRDFGFYAFAVALGVGLGPVAGLPLYPVVPHLAFCLGGCVTLVAALFIYRAWPAETGYPSDPEGKTRLDLGGHFLGLGTAWVQGFLEGGMITFLSVYLLSLGYPEAGVSGLMGALFLGVVLFQVPVAWLADRLGRARVLLACHGTVLASLACLPFCTGPWGMSVGLFVVGACCAALYPLGLALLGERVPADALAGVNAWYLASNCAGSLSGPVLIGMAMDLWGRRALFGAGLAAVLLVLGGWTCLALIGPRPGKEKNQAADGKTRTAA